MASIPEIIEACVVCAWLGWPLLWEVWEVVRFARRHDHRRGEK